MAFKLLNDTTIIPVHYNIIQYIQYDHYIPQYILK